MGNLDSPSGKNSKVATTEVFDLEHIGKAKLREKNIKSLSEVYKNTQAEILNLGKEIAQSLEPGDNYEIIERQYTDLKQQGDENSHVILRDNNGNPTNTRLLGNHATPLTIGRNFNVKTFKDNKGRPRLYIEVTTNRGQRGYVAIEHVGKTSTKINRVPNNVLSTNPPTSSGAQKETRTGKPRPVEQFITSSHSNDPLPISGNSPKVATFTPYNSNQEKDKTRSTNGDTEIVTGSRTSAHLRTISHTAFPDTTSLSSIDSSNEPTRLSEEEISSISKELILRKRDSLDKFFNERIRKLHQNDVGEIFLQLAKADFFYYEEQFTYLKYFNNSSSVEQIFTISARSRPAQFFNNYSQIHKYPWAINVLVDATQYTSNKDLKDISATSIYLNDDEKARLNKTIKKNAERRGAVALLAQREIKRINNTINLRSSDDTTGSDRHNESEKYIDEIVKDPALFNILEVDEELCKKAYISITLNGYISPIQINDDTEANFFYLNLRAMVTRNLYFKNIDISKPGINKEEVIKSEVKDIVDTWNELRDISIFNGRNVIVAANNEMSGNSPDFGNDTFIGNIRNSGGKIEKPFRGADNEESLKKTKEDILNGIATQPPPLTFVADAHGSGDAIYLSNGQNMGSDIVEGTKITLEDLFTSYQKRRSRFGEFKSILDTDIFLFHACKNSTFARRFIAMCTENGIQPPIAIGPSEYGQLSYGYALNLGRNGNELFDEIFKGGHGRATLGRIIQFDSRASNGNSSIYMAGRDKKLRQVVDKRSAQNGEVELPA